MLIIQQTQYIYCCYNNVVDVTKYLCNFIVIDPKHRSRILICRPRPDEPLYNLYYHVPCFNVIIRINSGPRMDLAINANDPGCVRSCAVCIKSNNPLFPYHHIQILLSEKIPLIQMNISMWKANWCKKRDGSQKTMFHKNLNSLKRRYQK